MRDLVGPRPDRMMEIGPGLDVHRDPQPGRSAARDDRRQQPWVEPLASEVLGIVAALGEFLGMEKERLDQVGLEVEDRLIVLT